MTNEKHTKTELTNTRYFLKTDKSWTGHSALTRILAYQPTLMGCAILGKAIFHVCTLSQSGPYTSYRTQSENWQQKFTPLMPGPGCSKLTTSLVNVSLKFQTLISNICQYFLLKKCEKLLQCKGFSHFFNKKYQCI